MGTNDKGPNNNDDDGLENLENPDGQVIILDLNVPDNIANDIELMGDEARLLAQYFAEHMESSDDSDSEISEIDQAERFELLASLATDPVNISRVSSSDVSLHPEESVPENPNNADITENAESREQEMYVIEQTPEDNIMDQAQPNESTKEKETEENVEENHVKDLSEKQPNTELDDLSIDSSEEIKVPEVITFDEYMNRRNVLLNISRNHNQTS